MLKGSFWTAVVLTVAALVGAAGYAPEARAGTDFCFEQFGPTIDTYAWDIALAAFPDGRVAASYVRDRTEVWYAELNGCTWDKSLVCACDAGESADWMRTSIAILPWGEPAIAYCRLDDVTGEGSMWYSWREQGLWRHERVTDPAAGNVAGQRCSLGVSSVGEAAVGYAYWSIDDLHTHTAVAWRAAPNSWQSRDVDSVWWNQYGGYWSPAASLVFQYPGQAVISYYFGDEGENDSYSLRVATGQGWPFDRMFTDFDPSQSAYMGMCSKVAVDSAGHPAAAYVKDAWPPSSLNLWLRYAEFDGDTWQVEQSFGGDPIPVVGAPDNRSGGVGIGMLAGDQPAIACTVRVESAPFTCLAWREGGTWRRGAIFGEWWPPVADAGALIVTASGHPAVPYYRGGFPDLTYVNYAVGWRLCRGDTNCDGRVTFGDIDRFVAAIGNNRAAWRATFGSECPTCCFWNCDANGDGSVTFADIDPFVALIGTTCP